MVKEDIVALITDDTGYSKSTVTEVVDSLLTNITFALSKGRKVHFRGFGIFEAKKRAPRTGRNPHTGDKVPIPERIVPVFIAGKSLKSFVIKND